MASQMVSMNVMLAIHCKRTNYVDLQKPLKNYIRQQFSDRDAQEAEEDLQSVQSLRNSVERQGDSLEERKEVLQKYYRALCVMEARFPIGPDRPPLNNIHFSWQDAFKTSKKASQQSIVFEKAAVVFNLAATWSQMGLAGDRTTGEGLKRACHCFQASAGAFGFLREKLSARATGFMSTIDITPECAGMLERLMLGQAQECFFEKSIADDKAPSIRARLAMQVGLLYEEANAALTLPPLSSQFDRSWVANVQCKALLFQAEALYHMSLHLRKEDEVAEEIARLRAAKELLVNAKRQGKGGLQPLLDTVSKLEGTVDRALVKAENENDKVYLMRVPNNSSLPPIPGAPLAAPISPESVLDPTQEKLFSNIIPDSRTKDLSRYTDLVDAVVREQNERMQSETELAKVRLKELDLPELLQALEGDVSVWVPQKLREDWQTAQQGGGASGLQGELLQLQDLRRVNEGLLASLDETLESEAREDAQMRGQFGSRWTRPSSTTLTKSLKDRASAFAGNLKQAGASDERIEKEFQQSGDLLSVLNHTRIEDTLPRISRPIVAVHGDDQAVVGRLRQLLGELEGLGAQRAALEVKLKDMARQENIMPQLMNTGSASCDDLFKRELAKYDPVVADVTSNIQAQRKLLDDIKAQTHLFCSTFNIPEYKGEVERVIKKVESAVAKHKELSNNIHEGLKFYVAMQDAITALKQQCTDFVMTRNIQSRDLIDELQRKLSGFSFAGSTPPPAAAPPPPQGGYYSGAPASGPQPGQVPGVQGYYTQGGQSGGVPAPQYGVQPGLYGQPGYGSAPYGVPPPNNPYGQPPNNPYPQYPQYRPGY